MSAPPLKLTPAIVLAVSNVVAVPAFPEMSVTPVIYPAPLVNWLLLVILFASVAPVYPRSAKVNVLVDTVPLASVTRPLVSVVMLISKSDITVAPVNAVVSISISSPAKLVGNT